jgi:hypothetical protein
MKIRYDISRPPSRTPGFDAKRELDELIGPYGARPKGERLAVRILRIVARGLLGAAAAIAVALGVMWVLHTHVRDAQRAPVKLEPGKPVPIEIIPAK